MGSLSKMPLKKRVRPSIPTLPKTNMDLKAFDSSHHSIVPNESITVIY